MQILTKIFLQTFAVSKIISRVRVPSVTLKERGISVMIFLFLCYIIYQTFGKIIFSDIAVEILLFVS